MTSFFHLRNACTSCQSPYAAGSKHCAQQQDKQHANACFVVRVGHLSLQKKPDEVGEREHRERELLEGVEPLASERLVVRVQQLEED